MTKIHLLTMLSFTNLLFSAALPLHQVQQKNEQKLIEQIKKIIVKGTLDEFINMVENKPNILTLQNNQGNRPIHLAIKYGRYLLFRC